MVGVDTRVSGMPRLGASLTSIFGWEKEVYSKHDKGVHIRKPIPTCFASALPRFQGRLWSFPKLDK